MMNRGVVVEFDKHIGYGFIRRPDGKNIFMQAGSADSDDFTCELRSGDRVGFIPKTGFEKYMAAKVWKI